jgi:hypothetical protein
MKHRDLNACIACLKRLQADEALDPGLKKTLQGVARRLRKLSGRATVDRDLALEVIREAMETMWKAFQIK